MGPRLSFRWRLLPKVTVVTWFFSFSFTTAFCCYYSLLHGCDATFGWQATWKNFSDENQLAPDSCRLNNFLVTKHSPLIFTPIDSSRKALSNIFWLQLDPVKRSDVKLRKTNGDRWRALSICDLFLIYRLVSTKFKLKFSIYFLKRIAYSNLWNN